MIFIDRNSVPVPDIFFSKEIMIAREKIEEFYTRPQSTRAQQRFSKPFEPQLRNKFIDPLRMLFHEKCAYCESHISEVTSNSVYDHFRPKNGSRGLEKEFSNEHYWWLTYEWNNLYYSCQICNRYKATWFPVETGRAPIRTPYFEIIGVEKSLLIDPCNDRPEEHLVYLDNGNVDFLSSKGRTTIEILKLNRIELIEARKAAVNILFNRFEELLVAYNKKRKDREKIKEISLEWEDIFSNFSTKPYKAIQRQFLSKWLNDRPEIQSYIGNKEYELLLETRRLEWEGSRVTEIVEDSKKYDKESLAEDEKSQIEASIKLERLNHVYIEKLELKHFKCFEELIINFDSENLNIQKDKSLYQEPWLLFLGENGVGKSSILKAITIALCGEKYFKKLALSPTSLLQRNKKNGYIHVYLKGEEYPIKVYFDKERITSSIKDPKAHLIGYGSIRLLPKEKKLFPERYNQGNIKAQNLFDYSISLINADKWLLERNENDFDRAALTLKDLMLLEGNDLLRRDIENEKIYIQRKKTKLYIDELSDGYQSVYALAVDIMASFVRDNITYDIAEGIVLIDEIGTHLHPRWKMEVVSQLKRTFPRMQFIVTSHEPLCLRGLKQGEVTVLTKDWNNKIYAITDLPDPASLRVDQILTSPFFGLHSAVDPDTEKLFNEYYSLLAKSNLTNIEENRKLELSDLIPKMKYLGDTLREELAIYVIDELLAKNIKEEKGQLNIKQLKEESINRVKSIWDSLKTNTEE